MILAMDNPKLAFDPTMPDRWAEGSGISGIDAQLALAAFRARRDEALRPAPHAHTQEQWKRAGIHATRGPITINDFVTLMAWHDDNHLDQLKRALEGRSTRKPAGRLQRTRPRRRARRTRSARRAARES